MTMSIRFLFGVVLALVAVGMMSESQAADTSGPGYGPRYRQSYVPRRSRSYVYRQERGWTIFGYTFQPFVNHGEAYNFPGHYNNQTFWERVQSQPNYPVQY
jgi:hypothetical protein